MRIERVVVWFVCAWVGWLDVKEGLEHPTLSHATQTLKRAFMIQTYLARAVDAQQAKALPVGDAQRDAAHRELAALVHLGHLLHHHGVALRLPRRDALFLLGYVLVLDRVLLKRRRLRGPAQELGQGRAPDQVLEEERGEEEDHGFAGHVEHAVARDEEVEGLVLRVVEDGEEVLLWWWLRVCVAVERKLSS